MARRTILGTIAAVVGATFLAVTFASRLFTVAPAFERMSGDFRPVMTESAIATMRTDLASMTAVGDEYLTKAVPVLSQALGVTTAEFSASVAQRYPAVAAGVQALPQIAAEFGTVADTLDAERVRFASADALPTTSLPSTTIPWGLVLAGIVAIGLGWGLISHRMSAAPSMMILLGLVLVVSAVTLSFPRKSAHADQLNENLRPVYTAALVTQAETGISAVTAMASQMQNEMLPEIAASLDLTAAETDAFVGAQFPVIAAALENLPATIGRFNATVSVFDDNLANFDEIKATSLLPIAWMLIIGGAILFMIGASAYTRGRDTAVDETGDHRFHLRRHAA